MSILCNFGLAITIAIHVAIGFYGLMNEIEPLGTAVRYTVQNERARLSCIIKWLYKPTDSNICRCIRGIFICVKRAAL